MTLHQIAFLTFITVALLVLGLYQLLTKDTWEIKRRMQKITARTFRQRMAQTNCGENQTSTWRQLLARWSVIFAKRGISQRMEAELIKADIPLRGEEFVVLVLLLGLVSSLFFLMLTLNATISLIVGICGLIIPCLILRMARQKRLAKFNAQIGDALVIMANSLRSGFSFLQAMDMVRKELPNPISREFGRAFQEMSLGTPTEEALQNMAQRVKSDDLDLVITAVLIQRQVGGNLAEVLDNIADTIRERVRIKGQIRSITAQGRISGMVIGFLPFALAALMLVISPQYIMTLFNSKIGLIMVASAIFSEVIGVVAIKKIVDIEV
ncbi:Type II secretion system F domain protein [Desulfotomaculum nigrificans CO-1-SRB]|uniref:Type II secretion system F domain protein n=1 Tax=Desulfotomaculum nigrificans (strain DSM 14880 / VKM B-2319 / CO-1-SRB) TaxID=868595 RepID=F6B3L9_DESCC|nr:type II secretion system F family protein [Desulfotomaculum nigrificans]AEF94048.1 Type II secretion system F domain protein [Desulfotomaculum nigrificans CO-1-SRB]